MALNKHLVLGFIALASSFLLSHGFVCSQSNNSLFIFRRHSDVIYLLLYVDDIIVTGNSSTLVTHFLSLLAKCFAMKDLGDLHFFLGLRASRTSTVELNFLLLMESFLLMPRSTGVWYLQGTSMHGLLLQKS
ncbi:unnamed protein product [Cuscuta epithymum]|uniref:Reverse transcriptase Ty1/copia-type domain-containing protein n=1 Tax=Cuscuta epithymum TaxID=186058 RepID=A0AAV0D560_9ASTE|nr:unnamed protein product [Cuscuta epithymum]